jgi:hypothetical protein
MEKKTIDALYADFDKIEERKGLGGKTFKYLKPAPVIHRMNKVFKLNWSYEVVTQEVMEDWVVAKVRMYVWNDEDDHKDRQRQIFREAYGSATIERFTAGKNQGKMVDPGNAFKGAVSDAIKKAASTFGIGLHQLYDLDEESNGIFELGESEPVAVVPTEKTEPKSDTPPPVELDLSELKVPEPKPFDPPTVPDPTTPESEDVGGSITDVQRTAIKKMSEHKNTSVAEFMKRALGGAKELDALTYEEGILVIREANKTKTPK